MKQHLEKLQQISSELCNQYSKLQSTEKQINKLIYSIFGKSAINVGSVAYGRWAFDSDLDLAIGFKNDKELHHYLSLMGQHNWTYKKKKAIYNNHPVINYIHSGVYEGIK